MTLGPPLVRVDALNELRAVLTAMLANRSLSRSSSFSPKEEALDATTDKSTIDTTRARSQARDEDLALDWRGLDERIDGVSEEIERLARADVGAQRLMNMPGIGPIISSAMVAAIGTGATFSKGRDFAASLGLVPKQIFTGDRTILGAISRRGNRYLRVLFVQAAWVVLVRPKNWEHYELKTWIEAAKKHLHHNVLAIALANKLGRIAWAVLARGRNFEVTRSHDLSPQPA
jgi:transposase